MANSKKGIEKKAEEQSKDQETRVFPRAFDVVTCHFGTATPPLPSERQSRPREHARGLAPGISPRAVT